MNMEKLILSLSMILIVTGHLVIAGGRVDHDDMSPRAVEKWFKHFSHGEEKLTKLHFYFHDIPSGNNFTTVRVAQANITATSPSNFGAVVVMDEPLTEQPEFTSKLIGRAQGMYAVASQKEFDLLMTLNFVFIGGKYGGSTLSVLGYNPVPHEYREMPILGGSGIFRLARGIATAKTHSFNATTLAAVVEYNVIVLHY